MNSLKTLVVTSLIAALGFVSAADFVSDPAHTFAVWRATHADVSYTFGTFDEFTANLTYDAAAPEESAIEFTILTESVDSGMDLPDTEGDGAARDGHLRSPDFFDVAQFPTIDFVSTGVTAIDDTNLEVTGNLTVHGVTNEITIEVEKTGEGQNQNGDNLVGFYSEFMIDRTDYGMNNLLQAAGPEVLMMISFEGVEQ